MSGEQHPPIDDETLILQILDQDGEGLVKLLELYGPNAKGYLVKYYGNTLGEADIDVALDHAVERVWKYAASFDPDKGSLKSWFMRIAQREAINIIEDREKNAGVDYDLEQHIQPENDCSEPEKETQQMLDDLEYVIEHKLPALQQAIIRADLRSQDVASAEWLARIHNTSKNSIYVSRKKARHNIEKYMAELAAQRQSKGGKK